MQLVRGSVVSRDARDLKVKLSNGQEIKTVRVNKTDLNEDEQYPRVKEGTEVLVLVDKNGSAFTVGSIAQTTSLGTDKQYLLKNEIVKIQAGDIKFHDEEGGGKADTIDIKSEDTTIDSTKWDQKGEDFTMTNDKTTISNGSDELFEVLTDLVSTLASLKVQVMSGSSVGLWTIDPGSKAKLESIKTKLDAFN